MVKTWLPQLEKQLEKLSENAHENYRLFLSAEPASKPENHIIPQVEGDAKKIALAKKLTISKNLQFLFYSYETWSK